MKKEKFCTKYKIYKTLDNFHKTKLRKDGLNSWCKLCTNGTKDQPSQVKLWRLKNPHKGAAIQAKRRAKLRNATPKWLNKDHSIAIENFYIEANNKTKQTNIKWEVDHIIPLQGKLVSGLHVPWNLQIITKPKNISKGNRI